MPSRKLEELDWRPTPVGEISLRRRRDPVTDVEIYEVKLGEEFLMSSQFTAAEIAMAELALGRLDGAGLVVVVGGLGLGYTAQAVLSDRRVAELMVVEAVAPVLDWHRRGLVPVGPVLTADPRCRLVLGDFFALTAGPGWDPTEPGRRVDAVLVDIDHSPRHQLAEGNAWFYTAAGVRELARHLRPGGVFSLWSNDPPDEEYLAVLAEVFVEPSAEVVRSTTRCSRAPRPTRSTSRPSRPRRPSRRRPGSRVAGSPPSVHLLVI